jgi:NADP-dependent 3-hydroxy acid dehydrogenase YdfG
MDVIKDTVAVVTDASSGIGQGIARMLAAEGVKVALVARRQHELQRIADEIRPQGGTALIAPADLRDERALRAVAEQTRTMLGPIDILVNNAGIVYSTPAWRSICARQPDPRVSMAPCCSRPGVVRGQSGHGWLPCGCTVWRARRRR